MGHHPIVINADDLEDDPEGSINAYCQALDIPFLPHSLSWESEHREKWDIWKDWHADAARSTGIRKTMKTVDATIDNNDTLNAFYDQQMPYYEMMYDRHIRPEKPI